MYRQTIENIRENKYPYLQNQSIASIQKQDYDLEGAEIMMIVGGDEQVIFDMSSDSNTTSLLNTNKNDDEEDCTIRDESCNYSNQFY